MSWNSGAGSVAGGAAYVAAEGEPDVVRIDDADVRADELERLMLELGAEPMHASSSSEYAGPNDDDCDDDCTCGDDLG